MLPAMVAESDNTGMRRPRTMATWIHDDDLPIDRIMFFTPSQHDVRRFFCETYRKSVDNALLTPLEAIARDWIVQHPEYAPDFDNVEEALARDYSVDSGQTNPFLHLSMHLSIAEQISIDQPPGIRAAFQNLARRLDSEHEAHHHIMECLGQMLWKSQRTNTPPDGVEYIECIKQRAS